MVTSTGAGDGKTVTALNLAVAAAGNGRRPLLVDADVRTHGLTRISGLDSVPGLTNVAGETGTVTDLIRPWGVGPKTDLRFVPAGNTETPDPARFFRSPGFQNAIPLLTADQVLSIIDAPPVLEVPETTDIARHVDAVLLVVGAGTSVKKLDEARERISMTGKPIVGYVYNRTAEGFRKYGYGYGSGSG